jgi:hypothetical protein
MEGCSMSTPTTIDFTQMRLNDAINRAVADTLNNAAPDLTPVRWLLFYSGAEPQISGMLAEGGEEMLQRWAAALGLEPVDPITAGTREVSGTAVINHSRHTLQLWCIVDQAAYDADMAAWQARCKP